MVHGTLWERGAVFFFDPVDTFFFFFYHFIFIPCFYQRWLYLLNVAGSCLTEMRRVDSVFTLQPFFFLNETKNI